MNDNLSSWRRQGLVVGALVLLVVLSALLVQGCRIERAPSPESANEAETGGVVAHSAEPTTEVLRVVAVTPAPEPTAEMVALDGMGGTDALASSEEAANASLPPLSDGAINYTISAGDTLYAIAERFDVSVQAILAYNNIENPDSLQVGDVLLIPQGAQATVTPTPVESPDGTPVVVIQVPEVDEALATIHYVQAGETLSEIAAQYDTTVDVVMAANGLTPDTQLIAGEPLIIPKNPLYVTPMPTRTPIPTVEIATPTPTPLSLLAMLQPSPTPIPPTPTPIVYEVRAGDTPSKIAKAYGITVDQLLAANPRLSPTRMRIGDKVLIPLSQNVAVAAEPTPTPTPVIIFETYTVREDESPKSIAERFKVALDALLTFNALEDGDQVLEPGSTLRIPIGTPTPTPTPTPLPTPTPMPRLPYAAPVPLMPVNGMRVSGTTPVVLSWTSSGILEDNMAYVVRLRYVRAGQVVHSETFTTRATSLRLPPEVKPIRPTLMRWNVLIVRQVQQNGETVVEAVSPLSESREFYWMP
ncbi:hypothetical protein ARMA_1619 [Ardenticatena maritima]|uniref:LysM domain-containing protein n=1 Tax=Ardenticatena maritima TaxID=872965 RepID=A0A0M8K9S4_9CHLR|nr:LysM peptidoglycan-binding domain-containing protein [Ardenticatena maritima]KPL88527.1 hypothetical protein SE16_07015 [Ardenticatena maritima]GAP63196.1 hypothetical protein ARMA_1619 [Ardenticatena maritima]